MPRLSASRITAGILWVLTCGRSRSDPRAMAIMASRLLLSTGRKINNDGLRSVEGSLSRYLGSMTARSPGFLGIRVRAGTLLPARGRGQELALSSPCDPAGVRETIRPTDQVARPAPEQPSHVDPPSSDPRRDRLASTDRRDRLGRGACPADDLGRDLY